GSSAMSPSSLIHRRSPATPRTGRPRGVHYHHTRPAWTGDVQRDLRSRGPDRAEITGRAEGRDERRRGRGGTRGGGLIAGTGPDRPLAAIPPAPPRRPDRRAPGPRAVGPGGGRGPLARSLRSLALDQPRRERPSLSFIVRGKPRPPSCRASARGT